MSITDRKIMIRCLDRLMDLGVFNGTWVNESDQLMLACLDALQRFVRLKDIYQYEIGPLDGLGYWDAFDLQSAGAAFALHAALRSDLQTLPSWHNPALVHRIASACEQARNINTRIRWTAALTLQNYQMHYDGDPIHLINGDAPWMLSSEWCFQLAFIRAHLPNLRMNRKYKIVEDQEVLNFQLLLKDEVRYNALMEKFLLELEPLRELFCKLAGRKGR